MKIALVPIEAHGDLHNGGYTYPGPVEFQGMRCISLAPPNSPEGEALVLYPDGERVRGLDLGDNVIEKLPALVRRSLGNRLDRTLDRESSLADVIAELLILHSDDGAPRRWNRLRPTYYGPNRPLVMEVRLGGIIWSRPVVAGGANAADDYDRGDSSDLGPDWDEVSGDWQIVSNTLRIITLSTLMSIRHTSDLVGHDNEAQVDLTGLATPSSLTNIFGPACRYRSTAETFYAFTADRDAITGVVNHRLSRVVSGTRNVIAGPDVWIGGPTVPTQMLTRASGSTISGLRAGAEIQSVTDTGIETGLRGGVYGRRVSNGTNVDAFFMQDVFADIDGSGTGTLGAISGSGSGDVVVQGSGTVALGAIAGAGTGTVEVEGTGSGQVGPIAASGTGAVEVVGEGQGDLPAIAATGTGEVEATAQGEGSIGPISATGTGTTDVSGTGQGDLGAIQAAGTGAVEVSGTGEGVIGPVSATGSVSVEVSGQGQGDLLAISGTGSGTVSGAGPITGSGTGTLGAIEGSGTGAVEVSGQGEGSLGPISGSGAGTITGDGEITGSGTGTIGPLAASGTGQVIVGGDGVALLGPIVAAGTGTVLVQGAGTGALGAISGAGVGSVFTAIIIVGPTKLVLDPSRTTVHLDESASGIRLDPSRTTVRLD